MMADADTETLQNGTAQLNEEEEERLKQRPADIDADVREMERRKRVEALMSSKLFREELERVLDQQMNEGSDAPLLQRIREMVGGRLHSGSLRGPTCVLPINDIRGIEGIGYEKGEKILRCKLAAVYRLVDLFGWTQTGIQGQISARLNTAVEQVLTTPRGLLPHEVTASSLVKVDMQGVVQDQGTTNFPVNVEGFSVHAAVHAARPDLRCVLHLRAPAALAVSASRGALLPVSHEAAALGDTPVHTVPHGILDNEERDKLVRALGPHAKLLILTNCGVLCCGATLEEAFHYARLFITAADVQLKLAAVPRDDLVLLDPDVRRQIYEASQKPPQDQTKWRVGGEEFEALMRMLDNAGFRTGYIYRHPLIKNDVPRPKNDVEVPPAVSSLGYLLEEEELYRQGIWKKGQGKTGERTRWLNSPNVYQKVEVLETGTNDPKKITKWVDANNDEWVQDGSPNHSSTPVKIDTLQFVPKNTNPKEFKKLQQQIKDNRRADKISAGPQSHILEGVTWDEASKLVGEDAVNTHTGDHVVLMGAASKGIIQRGYQHNATMYSAPYARNPFDHVTDSEIADYTRAVHRKQTDYDTDLSESEAISGVQITSPASAVSETEEESRDEHRVLRIETTQAPVRSQPEVVLSDVDTTDFLNSERAHAERTKDTHNVTSMSDDDVFVPAKPPRAHRNNRDPNLLSDDEVFLDSAVSDMTSSVTSGLTSPVTSPPPKPIVVRVQHKVTNVVHSRGTNRTNEAHLTNRRTKHEYTRNSKFDDYLKIYDSPEANKRKIHNSPETNKRQTHDGSDDIKSFKQCNNNAVLNDSKVGNNAQIAHKNLNFEASNAKIELSTEAINRSFEQNNRRSHNPLRRSRNITSSEENTTKSYDSHEMNRYAEHSSETRNRKNFNNRTYYSIENYRKYHSDTETCHKNDDASLKTDDYAIIADVPNNTLSYVSEKESKKRTFYNRNISKIETHVTKQDTDKNDIYNNNKAPKCKLSLQYHGNDKEYLGSKSSLSSIPSIEWDYRYRLDCKSKSLPRLKSKTLFRTRSHSGFINSYIRDPSPSHFHYPRWRNHSKSLDNLHCLDDVEIVKVKEVILPKFKVATLPTTEFVESQEFNEDNYLEDISNSFSSQNETILPIGSTNNDKVQVTDVYRAECVEIDDATVDQVEGEYHSFTEDFEEAYESPVKELVQKDIRDYSVPINFYCDDYKKVDTKKSPMKCRDTLEPILEESKSSYDDSNNSNEKRDSVLRNSNDKSSDEVLNVADGKTEEVSTKESQKNLNIINTDINTTELLNIKTKQSEIPYELIVDDNNTVNSKNISNKNDLKTIGNKVSMESDISTYINSFNSTVEFEKMEVISDLLTNVLNRIDYTGDSKVNLNLFAIKLNKYDVDAIKLVTEDISEVMHENNPNSSIIEDLKMKNGNIVKHDNLSQEVETTNEAHVIENKPQVFETSYQNLVENKYNNTGELENKRNIDNVESSKDDLYDENAEEHFSMTKLVESIELNIISNDTILTESDSGSDGYKIVEGVIYYIFNHVFYLTCTDKKKKCRTVITVVDIEDILYTAKNIWSMDEKIGEVNIENHGEMSQMNKLEVNNDFYVKQGKQGIVRKIEIEEQVLISKDNNSKFNAELKIDDQTNKEIKISEAQCKINENNNQVTKETATNVYDFDDFDSNNQECYINEPVFDTKNDIDKVIIDSEIAFKETDRGDCFFHLEDFDCNNEVSQNDAIINNDENKQTYVINREQNSRINDEVNVKLDTNNYATNITQENESNNITEPKASNSSIKETKPKKSVDEIEKALCFLFGMDNVDSDKALCSLFGIDDTRAIIDTTQRNTLEQSDFYSNENRHEHSIEQDHSVSELGTEVANDFIYVRTSENNLSKLFRDNSNVTDIQDNYNKSDSKNKSFDNSGDTYKIESFENQNNISDATYNVNDNSKNGSSNYHSYSDVDKNDIMLNNSDELNNSNDDFTYKNDISNNSNVLYNTDSDATYKNDSFDVQDVNDSFNKTNDLNSMTCKNDSDAKLNENITDDSFNTADFTINDTITNTTDNNDMNTAFLHTSSVNHSTPPRSSKAFETCTESPIKKNSTFSTTIINEHEIISSPFLKIPKVLSMSLTENTGGVKYWISFDENMVEDGQMDSQNRSIRNPDEIIPSFYSLDFKNSSKNAKKSCLVSQNEVYDDLKTAQKKSSFLIPQNECSFNKQSPSDSTETFVYENAQNDNLYSAQNLTFSEYENESFISEKRPIYNAQKDRLYSTWPPLEKTVFYKIISRFRMSDSFDEEELQRARITDL